MINNYLKGYMALHGDTNKDLASYLGVTRQTIGNKLKGKSDWTRKEIDIITTRYKLSPRQVKQVFFTDSYSDYYRGFGA